MVDLYDFERDIIGRMKELRDELSKFENEGLNLEKLQMQSYMLGFQEASQIAMKHIEKERSMDKYEAYVVGHYLADWPENLGYKEILAIMANGDDYDHITQHEMYEHIPVEDLAVIIDEMVVELKKGFP